ncbi:MAG: peptidylprolyl isomerase [Saprospirales bacterium]|nr:MAG: peptidylprolyl isomerase [Saprospirales bacterium]
MKNLFFVLVFFSLLVSCQQDTSTYAKIETSYGDIIVRLYDSTPLHRDNFIKLANDGFYDGLLFHRIINGFMIQGGDPNSKNATADQFLGAGGPGYTIEAEIGAIHLKGALAAARTQNPEKRSSGSQFYIVHGTQQTEENLRTIEQMKGIRYTEEQIALYIENGGTPNLDMDYTVFGEVVSGIEVIDRIAAVQTGPNDRPVEDVRMAVRVLENYRGK